MAENQISSKDRLKEITDSIESGIKDLFDSDKYKQLVWIVFFFKSSLLRIGYSIQ